MRLSSLIFALALALVAAQSWANGGFLRLQGHGGPVKGVAVSADGKHALSASFDYSVGLWRLDGTAPVFLQAHEAGVNAVAFTPDGRALSAGDDFRMILWDVDQAKPLKRFEGHRGKILHIALSPDGRFAATSGWDGAVGLWDLDAQTHVAWLKGHRGNVNASAFSRDGSNLYSASSDGTIRIWDIEARALQRTMIKHGFGVNQLILNEAAGWLAYGAVDGAVRAIDLATDEEIADLSADRKPILALSLSADGTKIAVGDGEGYVMIIDAERWKIDRDFHAAVRGPIWTLAWTPDGTRLLSGGLSDAATLWPVSASEDEVAGLLSVGERSFLRSPDEMSNGERQFARKCSICHTLTKDGANRAGPSLWGLFGRRAGTYPGYSYSDALDRSEIIWSSETIDRLFLDGPDHYTPGSKMPMQQIAKASDRQDLVDFLAGNTGPPARETQGEKP
ncbi:MAG: c-type cytochrome [Pseudomonadota bacterium]